MSELQDKCRLRRESSAEKQVRQDSEHIDRCAARTQASRKIVWTGPPHAGMLHAKRKTGVAISLRRIVPLSARRRFDPSFVPYIGPPARPRRAVDHTLLPSTAAHVARKFCPQ